jgi:hypothetical protein
MKLLNTTPHPALLLRNITPRPQRMMACVIARVVHEIAEDGALRPRGPAWPIGPSPCDTPLGRASGDKPFYLGGVDVLLGGRVQHPGRAAGGRLDVELSVGRAFRRRIAVFGDRRWVRTPDGTLAPGAPQPFVSLPLTYDLAFGGRARNPNGMESPHGPNPGGRGYSLDEAAAEGKPLPNLEDPNELVTRWNDRPTPVGLGHYPEDGTLRPQGAINHPGLAGVVGNAARGASPAPSPVDVPLGPSHLAPTFFNQAHPAMVIEAGKAPRAGDWIRLSHGRRDGGELAFSLPEPEFHLHVQLEDRERLLPLHLDQIGILAGDERVLLSYRVVLEYRLVRRERRVATLHPGPLPDAIPAGYRRDLRDEWDEKWWDDDACA